MIDDKSKSKSLSKKKTLKSKTKSKKTNPKPAKLAISFLDRKRGSVHRDAKERKINIAKSLGIDPSEINDETMKFFYLRYPDWCCNVTNPEFLMFPFKIQKWETTKMMNEMIDYFKGADLSFYKECLKITKVIDSEKKVYIGPYNNHSNEIWNLYTKCRSNMKPIVIIGKHTKKQLEDFISKLVTDNNETIIYSLKSVKIQPNAFNSMMYHLHGYRDRFSTLESNEFKLNKSSNPITDFHYLLLESDSSLSQPINSFDNSSKDSSKDSYSNSIKPLVCESLQEAVHWSQIFYNDNTLDMIQKVDLSRHLHIGMRRCRTYVQTFKKWWQYKVNPIDQLRFMVFSSAILYSYGVRDCNDLDIYLSAGHPKLSKSKTPNLDKEVDAIAINPKTKLHFIDLSSPGYDDWIPKERREHWNRWFLSEFPKAFGAKNMDETIFNPQFHFYFMGLKLIYWNADIVRRQLRKRPASYADLIAINQLTNQKVEIPPLPETFYRTVGVQNTLNTPEKINKFLNSISLRLYERYNITMSVDDLKKLFDKLK